MNSHSQTDYTSFSRGSFQKNSVKSNHSPSLDRKDANPHCAIKVVNGITQEIDCHCHSYQFWFVIFLVLYVANFVNAIFVMSKYYSAEISPAPQRLYITYAVMGLIIVIVYVLMEIETWTIHNGTLYLYSILLMTLNYFAIKTLLQNQESDSFKKILFDFGTQEVKKNVIKSVVTKTPTKAAEYGYSDIHSAQQFNSSVNIDPSVNIDLQSPNKTHSPMITYMQSITI